MEIEIKKEVKELCPYYELGYCSNKFNGDIRSKGFAHNKGKVKHKCFKEICPLDLNSPNDYINKGDEM
jgi:hypothetical protein